MSRRLSPDDESSLRLSIVRQIADDVAGIIAGVESAEINGNVHLPKPPLVSALSRYFDDAGADRDAFVTRCYRR
ncbi:MAG: hypothetical protein E6J43_03590 [Chloroflexi bacterium]|nr:MAG: hypothetical protein E6J43_03590 [Chloroflexota bacterium]